MKNSSTIQQGVEVVRSFDALGRTENYALRAVDRNVKQALVDIVMSPLNAGEDPRTHRRTIHFVGSSWSYITDANGLLSTQNLGVVVVRGVSPDWKDGKVQDGREFVTQVRREGDFHVLSVILMRPFITNLVLELSEILSGEEMRAETVISGVEGFIDIGISEDRAPQILQAFGSNLNVS